MGVIPNISGHVKDNRNGLIVAHMQARIKPPRALEVIVRQRRLLEAYVSKYGIPVDLWHVRVKGMMPIPTLDETIEQGKVYAVLTTDWDKGLGCKEYWGDLWELCNKHKVRRVMFSFHDFSHYGEPDLFYDGWWERP